MIVRKSREINSMIILLSELRAVVNCAGPSTNEKYEL